MPKKKDKPRPTMMLADVSSGAQWLHQITETDFRDQILKDLFHRMKAEGAIVDSIYVHGRYEHGVDWIVLEHGHLSDRFVGIQAKSRQMTKQGDSQRDSALAVKQQCESAYENRFNWQGNDIRLDSVQLWISAHITADAEAEFIAPLTRHKIPVIKAENIFSLIEKYCPRMISKIPGLAEAGYVSRMADPDPLATRLLGTQLNPKKHFIEPRFSRYSELSPSRVFDQRARKMREEPPVFLENLIRSGSNSFIVGGELSGKTYLLKRICCKVAALGHLPVFVDGAEISDKMPKTIHHLLIQHLTWIPLSILQKPESVHRTIYLLIDNVQALTNEQLDILCEHPHSKIVIILVGKTSRQLKGFATYYISGVKEGAVSKFIRSLDMDNSTVTALSDRATQYIQRTFGTSGLPMNPFTVSVMLAECQVAQRRLATPTFGRLIKRFVEGQLGSHTDLMNVDFETKNQFLTTIGGSNVQSFKVGDFRRKLAKYISIHGHPHTLIAFEQDLIDSGLLEYYDNAEFIRWTRTVFREYYWVTNLVREKKFNIITKRLLLGNAVCIGAIAGSQMANAHKVLNDLLMNFNTMDWMGNPKKKITQSMRTLPENILPNDAEEEILLSQVEEQAKDADVDASHPDKADVSQDDMLLPAPEERTEGWLLEYVRRFIEEKHYLVGNIASILVNARALSRYDKEKAAICVLRSNLRIGQYFSEVLKKRFKDKISPLSADAFPRFWGLVVNDMMIGDAFLTDIFRGLERGNISNQERLMLADLLVACGGEDPNIYVRHLDRNSEIADTLVIYMRLVYTYFFRFHKENEKKQFRDAMKSVRKLAKGFSLPPVT